MASEFPLVSIGNLVDRGHARLQTGPFGSQLHKHDYTDEGVPVIPTEGIGRGRIAADAALPLISETKAGELSRHRLMLGDILFARRGIQATGLSAIVEQEHVGSICGTGALLLRVDPNAVDPKFLAAYLSTAEAFDWLRANAVGAVMPNLNTSIISRLRVPLPPMGVQAAVGQFIGSLDDRIDLLRQTNATLEAIAQALFKSWFVDFDPVRAKAEGREPEGMDAATAALFPSEFEESELGLIPKGWSASSFGSVAEQCKGTVNPLQLPTTEFDHYSLPAFDAGMTPFIDLGEAIKSNKTPVPNNAVLISKLNPHIPRIWLVGGARPNAVCSTEFLVWRPASGFPPEFVYCLASSAAFNMGMKQLVTGTSNSHQRVKPDHLSSMTVMAPSQSAASAFGDLVRPLMQRVLQNRSTVQTLAAARDALLPRLISGKLRLPEVEKAIAEAVA